MRLYQRIILLVLFLVVSLISNRLSAAEVNERGEIIENSANGSINWTTGKIEARGYADPNQSPYEQMRAAQVAARAELLAILQGIRIKGESGVIRGKLEKDISETRLEGFLAHSRVTEPISNELGLVEVTAFVYINDTGNAVLTADTGLADAEGKTTVPGKSLPQTPDYTGLIIDAHEVILKPTMAPKILVEGDLAEIYPADTRNVGAMPRNSLAAYAGSMEKAYALKDYAGDNPLVVKAIGSANGSDVVISREDGAKIISSLSTHGFLKEGKVVIVVK